MEKVLLSRTEKKLFHIILNNQKGIFLVEAWKRFEEMTGKTYSRTTISTFLDRIEKKGYIERIMHGRETFIIPLITKEEYQLQEIEALCNTVFDGDINEMKLYLEIYGEKAGQD